MTYGVCIWECCGFVLWECCGGGNTFGVCGVGVLTVYWGILQDCCRGVLGGGVMWECLVFDIMTRTGKIAFDFPQVFSLNCLSEYNGFGQRNRET